MMDINVFIVFILIMFVNYINANESNQYCMRDIFKPECPGNSVIIITSAFYGRMQLGRCIPVDLGYLGCKTDVSAMIAHACSGKQRCEYPVFSEQLEETKPCIESLQPYLEVDYDCRKVIIPSTDKCTSPEILPDTSGTISSYISRQSGCGQKDAPWKLDFYPGQQINISIIDYQNKFNQNEGPRKCVKVGYIIEEGHMDQFSICRSSQRESHVYTSNGRSLSIFIDANQDENAEFLLKYSVFGCADIKVDKNTWYKREDNQATIGCERHDAEWYLKCEHNKWVGVLGNCSESAAKQDDSKDLSDLLPLSKGYMFWIIIIVCLGVLILCVFGIVIIVVKCKRTNQQPQCDPNKQNPLLGDESHYRGLIRQQPSGYTIPPGYSNTIASNSGVAANQTIPRHMEGPGFVNVPAGTMGHGSPGQVFVPPGTTGRSNTAKYFVLDKEYMNLKDQQNI